MHAYRTISGFVCLQAFCVVAGTLFVSQILKFSPPTVGDPREYRALAFWIREWGFVLLLLPLFWTAASLFATRQDDRSRAVFFSGGALTALLVVVYFLGMVSASRMPLLMVR